MKKSEFFLIVFLLFILGLVVAWAEVTHPYTIDEKTQVNFGDAATVSGHTGLENYTHEYVGGYLHITFTYTHNICCFSSYPPSLYITAENPTTLSSPTLRTEDVIYQILAGAQTDWYLYDIQFDASGYRKIVKQTGTTEIVNSHVNVTGITDTDYAALVNDYPIAPLTAFSMSFTPLLVHEAAAPPPSNSSNSPSASVSISRDTVKCVFTTIGWYCANSEVREQFTLMTISQILGFLGQELEFLKVHK